MYGGWRRWGELDGRDHTKLIDGQMEWLIEMTVDDWNIAIGSEDNLERTFVGRGDGFEGGSNARSRENRDVVDGYDESANILATNVPNPRGRGIRMIPDTYPRFRMWHSWISKPRCGCSHVTEGDNSSRRSKGSSDTSKLMGGDPNGLDLSRHRWPDFVDA
ncbi:hypothetical protein MHU86_15162 [Fragilaria crotonensis]|nr:hypothetical protein MHU86_15162 [Fragilaria crotonensis]